MSNNITYAIFYLGQMTFHACGFDFGLMIDVCYEPGRSAHS